MNDILLLNLLHIFIFSTVCFIFVVIALIVVIAILLSNK